MFERPELFQAVIAASPACVDWLFERDAQFAASGQPLKVLLFMTGAEKEWPEALANIKRFNARLETRSYEGSTYKWRLIDGERHAGTKAESYNRGIRFAFEPLAPDGH